MKREQSRSAIKREQSRSTMETAGMLVTLLLGNGLHFLYDWTTRAGWAAYLSAVNESTWEHMKLLAVPWLLWTAVTCIAQRSMACAAPRAAGLLAGLAFIPMAFYTYTGIIGASVDVVNVLLFQVAVLLAYWVSRALRRGGALTAPVWQAAGMAVQLGMAVLFVLWTLVPPPLPLFIDPTDGTRGMIA